MTKKHANRKFWHTFYCESCRGGAGEHRRQRIAVRSLQRVHTHARDTLRLVVARVPVAPTLHSVELFGAETAIVEHVLERVKVGLQTSS